MFCLTRKIFTARLQLAYTAVYSSSNTPTIVSEFNYKPKFNDAEQEKILNILNQSNKEQLLCLNVAQTKIKNLENYKKKKGPFKSLNELLEVDGLSVKLLDKLCKQIILETCGQNIKLPLNNENKKIKQILAPQLSRDVEIASAVGIHLAPMGVSWAKILKSENQIECWGHQDFINLPKKMCPTDTFRLAIDILSQLPVGDAYVFEGTSSMGLQGQKQATTLNSHTQQLELSSMLLALLNTSTTHNPMLYQNETTKTSGINCVYFLRPKLPARLFKTLVGNECVSSIATVHHLLGEQVMENFTLPCSPISLDQNLKREYVTQSSAHKELLGQALMLTVAFIDLCVKKNLISIKAISNGRK